MEVGVRKILPEGPYTLERSCEEQLEGKGTFFLTHSQSTKGFAEQKPTTYGVHMA
jgi:hypothetical protein